MPVETFSISAESAGERLDQFLARQLASQFSRSKIKTFILNKQVSVDGQAVKPNFRLETGQHVEIKFETSVADITRAEKIPIEVIYEDKDCLVVNKPAGLVVHPACGNLSGTLVNALLHHTRELSKLGGDIRAGIVHRLDKNTSGLLVVAKNDKAHQSLAKQFKQHKIEKVYWTVVRGVVEHDEMRCEDPLGRSPANRRKMTVMRETGKESRTNFKVLKRFENATLLEVRPETGRTHQIRVHLKSLGYPVLGDLEYGIPSALIGRQALHAKSLAFLHPTSKKKLSFDSKLPPDMASLIKNLP